MSDRWYCEKCDKWHNGLPPHCPNYREEATASELQEKKLKSRMGGRK
jgi:hypothetical protein